jgi:hypothetical protein
MKQTALFIILASAFAACHKPEIVNVSKAQISAGQTITSDSLSGSVKGTLASGRTYYFSADITINEGDTLLMQAGSKLIALGDGLSPATSPQITCNGSFISLGTADQQNYITVKDELRTTDNSGKGFWGGIQCGENSGDVIIKWTHLEFAGGAAGSSPDPDVFAAGDPRNALSFTNINANFILEDSWIYGTTDDGMRILHGHVSIMRNTFESCGLAGGESLNLKNGCVGDVAYNVSIGSATNGFKISNSGGGAVETNVNLFNNTVLNGGFRQLKAGRGGSIDFEKGAKGRIYNNIIVNCRFGLRITPDADTLNTTYGNQFYYANDSRLIGQFNSTDGVAKTQTGDIASTAPKANNPFFAQYDVDQFDYTSLKPPMDISQMPLGIRTAQSADFSLLPGSPALKKANADLFQAMRSVPQGGLYGASTQDPGIDMGAYQSDRSGNQHYSSSLSVN